MRIGSLRFYWLSCCMGIFIIFTKAKKAERLTMKNMRDWHWTMTSMMLWWKNETIKTKRRRAKWNGLT